MEAEKVSREESLKLIIDATNYLKENGYNSDSRSRIESNLQWINSYDIMEKKFISALKAVQIEIKEIEIQNI
jgi:hypothetical protein